METIKAGLSEYKTTVLGVAIAVVGYLYQLGPNLPATGKEWAVAGIAMGAAALGIAAKDAGK